MDLLVAAVLVLGVMALVRALHPFPSKCSKPPRTLPGSDANPALATLRWEAVRRVAHEDVTAFGEQIANVPVPRVINSDENADFDQALGAYERAKEILGVASHPDDFQAGPEFVPWVRGWYGASGSLLMHNMLMGTLLIDSLLLPSGYDYFDTDDEVEISVGHELGEYEYFDDESDFGFGSGVVDDYSGDLGSDFGGDLGGDYGGY